jgi:hexosaminidase
MSQRSFPRGAHLGIRWGLVSNHFDGDTFRAALTITNRGDARLPPTGWVIYFNSCRKPLPESVTGGVTIEHVNGDLFRLRPGAHFGNLAPGVSREIGYVAGFWSVLETDAPIGFYVVYGEGTRNAWAEAIGDPEIEPFSRPEQGQRNLLDHVPVRTAASTFDGNRKLSVLPEAAVGNITPTPLQASFGTGTFTLSDGVSIGHPPELWREARFLRDALARLTTQPLQPSAADQAATIRLRLSSELEVPEGGSPDEAYRLIITSTGADVSGRSPAGVFYGLQTLLQLVSVGAWQNAEPAIALPLCDISDAPRFGYRGLHLDVARNFSDKSTVLDVLDLMALYKLNKFHFHLTDDEGWRVPIASLPELTEIGSRRGWRDEPECLQPSFGSGPDVENPEGSGHYTQGDFIEILRHADARHIEVIPEIDLPGHARAAIRAMHVRSERLRAAGQLDEADAYVLVDPNDASKYESVQMWRDNVVCIGLESCYTFIDTVVRDVKQLYEDAGVQLRTVHVGGDEVPEGAWVNSPVCRAFMREQGMTSLRELEDYFFTRLRDILRRHRLGMAGWEEVALVTEQRDGAAVTNPNPRLLGTGVRPHVWNNVWGWGREDIAYRLANAGYEVVLCNVTNLYLDLAYEKDPAEPGYYWGGFLDTRKVFEFCPFDIYTLAKVDLLGNPLDPQRLARMARLTPEGQARVLGLQGHLWGENLRSLARTEYLLLPRLIAVAERGWAKDPAWTLIADETARAERMDADWNEFANRLGQRELPRLDAFLGGIGYRIPVPGAIVEHGLFSANVSAPGMTLRYTLDASEPTPLSPIYVAPVTLAPGATPRVAAFTTTGRRGRSATAINTSSNRKS